MKYFLDAEFLEGSQTKRFLGFNVGKTKPTIDLISIGIVAEDGREYYAVSDEFNLWEAWNRYDEVVNKNFPYGPEYDRVYWIRENVLRPIFQSWRKEVEVFENLMVHLDLWNNDEFTYKNFQNHLDVFGKSNFLISEEIRDFCYHQKYVHDFDQWKADPFHSHVKDRADFDFKKNPIEFYGYYADYDWVAFCWLFGKMIDLPKGFPMYCKDVKQILDEYVIDKSTINLPKLEGFIEHHALWDAKECKQLYDFIDHKDHKWVLSEMKFGTDKKPRSNKNGKATQ